MHFTTLIYAYTSVTATLAAAQWVMPPVNGDSAMDCAGSDGGDATGQLGCPDKAVFDRINQFYSDDTKKPCGCTLGNFCCPRGKWGDYRAEEVISQYKDGHCSCDAEGLIGIPPIV